MKTLWNPWRMEHVSGTAEKISGCLFEPPGQASSSKADLLLLRNEHTIVLLNRYPYANGHLLVAPRRHVADISDLTAEENLAVMTMLQHCVTILRARLQPDGFNLGLNLGAVAGAGIADHLHFHVVPRWCDDHNFMTVCAEIRTIPQHIEQTFDLLLADFTSLLFREGPA